MRLPVSALLATLLLAACQSAPPPPPTSADVVGEFRKGSGYVKGYLPPQDLPDSKGLLPAPPPAGSAAALADLDLHKATRALRGTPRFELAARDAELKFPAAASVFACTLDVPVSEAATPHLNMLLRRTLLDAGLATYGAKDHYKRQRPFAALGEGTCTPAEEAMLAKDGSYPSGHAALGWAWGLVLSELAPERARALQARAYEFGFSRVVCGVHWGSDVEAGRLIGAAAVARLHADPVFTAQAALARAEIAAARVRGDRPAGDCGAEAAALGR